MKQDNLELKKGDCIWVQSYDHYGLPSHFRMAEVIRFMQISACCNDSAYVVLKYLDAEDTVYECVPLNRVKGFCDAEKMNDR